MANDYYIDNGEYPEDLADDDGVVFEYTVSVEMPGFDEDTLEGFDAEEIALEAFDQEVQMCLKLIDEIGGPVVVRLRDAFGKVVQAETVTPIKN